MNATTTSNVNLANGLNGQSLVRQRRKRIFLCCIIFIGFFCYILPFLQLALHNVVMDYAYKKHVAPQIGQERIQLSTRMVPRLKHERIGQTLDDTKPAVLVAGNSHQFHIQRKFLEASADCVIPNFYNMSYAGWDPVDFYKMFAIHGQHLAEGSTVLLAVQPEIFIVDARTHVPSLYHPWTDLSLWWRNIRDGNTSLSSLYPHFINIEWPTLWDDNFPVVAYYRGLWSFARDGFPGVVALPDGSVDNEAFEKTTAERVARGEPLTFQRLGFAKESKNPLNPLSFKRFVDSIKSLTKRGVNVVAFEAVFHPGYEALRKNPERTRAYLAFMRDLEKNIAAFHYVSREKTWIELPDALWLDHSHVTMKGGKILVDHLGTVIDRKFVCLETTS